MAKKKPTIITDADLVDFKTTVPPQPKSKMIVMDESTQPRDFDWAKMEKSKSKKTTSTTNK